ncbi:MAG TPA: right-handed parallel beta-helix repeat-containing protein [Gemmatimonadaceae bacterium]|nr:right-handed parallel beta-helix repeat-containing protein [Gemmatimonadaceae bacterium]
MSRVLVVLVTLTLGCQASESKTVADGAPGRDGRTAATTARSYYVAPTGKPSGDGSAKAPWDLATALNQPEALQPGDTIWVRGGTYTGHFVSRLTGQPEAPIVVRAAPGEPVVIDGNLNVGGESAAYWGLEVMRSGGERNDEPGVIVHAPHSRFINLVVHDHGGAGFNFSADAPDAEIYGSIIYNNGSVRPGGEVVGQGIAAQNRDGRKIIQDNVVFDQFAHGILVYGSDAADLKNFQIEGNAVFNSGTWTKDGAQPDLLVGGGSEADGIVVTSNYTYRPDKATTAVFGYEWGPTNGELVLTDNVLVGSTKVITWKQITAMRNTFAGAETLLMLRIPEGEPLTPGYEWRENTYVAAEGKWQPFNLFSGQASAGGFFLADWQQKTQLDAESRYSRGRPTGTQVFVRPNRYEPGRAHVIVYNWDRQPTVTVPLGDALKRGTRFEVRSTQSLAGPPVLQGTYDGKPLTLPMRAVRPPTPLGETTAGPSPTGPEFDVFLVTPVSSRATDDTP